MSSVNALGKGALWTMGVAGALLLAGNAFLLPVWVAFVVVALDGGGPAAGVAGACHRP